MVHVPKRWEWLGVGVGVGAESSSEEKSWLSQDTAERKISNKEYTLEVKKSVENYNLTEKSGNAGHLFNLQRISFREIEILEIQSWKLNSKQHYNPISLITMDNETIARTFYDFYKKLYKMMNVDQCQKNHFLSHYVQIPKLHVEYWSLLEAPISQQKVLDTIKGLKTA